MLQVGGIGAGRPGKKVSFGKGIPEADGGGEGLGEGGAASAVLAPPGLDPSELHPGGVRQTLTLKHLHLQCRGKELQRTVC